MVGLEAPPALEVASVRFTSRQGLMSYICSRSWFVMNICMSHNVGMAVIYMTPIIRKYSIFIPKSEPEWPLQENGALAPHFASFQAVEAPAGRAEHTEASVVMPWLISDA